MMISMHVLNENARIFIKIFCPNDAVVIVSGSGLVPNDNQLLRDICDNHWLTVTKPQSCDIFKAWTKWSLQQKTYSNCFDATKIKCIWISFITTELTSISISLAGVLYGISVMLRDYIDGLVQDCSNAIANALELLQSCTKPSIFEWNTAVTPVYISKGVRAVIYQAVHIVHFVIMLLYSTHYQIPYIHFCKWKLSWFIPPMCFSYKIEYSCIVFMMWIRIWCMYCQGFIGL